MRNKAIFQNKYDQVFRSAISELQERGIFLESDIHLIEAYAVELASAHKVGKDILKLPASKETTLVRLSRIKNAHINSANQLAKTLKLGPYGRQRFGVTKPEKKEIKKASILRLAK